MIRKSSMCVAAAALFATVSEGSAQNWPMRPVKAILPFAAGTVPDVVCRIVFEQLSSKLGQPIVIESRGGAGGTIGAQQVAKSQPDGYTILVTTSAHTIAPAIYAHLGYDAAKDLTPVVPLGVTPTVLVVPAPKNIRTVAELVSVAKAQPGKLTYGSAGIGSATHFSAERFLASASVKAVHVPYKGGPEIINDLLAGQLDFFFGPIGIVKPYIADGKLNALAVNATRRSALLPELLTLEQAGVADAEYPFWTAMFVPSGTPQAIVDRLRRETVAVLAAPDVQTKLSGLGIEPMPLASAEFEALVQSEFTLNASLARSLGLKMQ